MVNRSALQYQWVPDEILVRVVEADYPAIAAMHKPAADVYAPSFHLWDGTPLLNLLFKATDMPRQKGQPAPVLLVNLLVPRDESADFPL